MSCPYAPPLPSWSDEPAYSKLAARLLAAFIDKEVQGLGIYSFSQSIRTGFDVGLINERVLQFVEANARKLNDAIDVEHTRRFEYFGIRTLYDRYLLKHPDQTACPRDTSHTSGCGWRLR